MMVAILLKDKNLQAVTGDGHFKKMENDTPGIVYLNTAQKEE